VHRLQMEMEMELQPCCVLSLSLLRADTSVLPSPTIPIEQQHAYMA